MRDSRRVLYVSGTRADFGLMRSTLASIDNDPRLDLGIAVTGMHLLPEFGNTVRELEDAGLPIVARIPVALEGCGASMARAISTQLSSMVDLCESWRPDWALLLGDRGEMLAAALAASHLMIPVAHIHGGERSGTIDESVRHAITKLSHVHLVATEESKQRVIRLGERPRDVHLVGAPGLDGLRDLANRSRRDLCGDLGLDSNIPVALLVFHPVLQEAANAGDCFAIIAEALEALNVQVVALAPNSDAGGVAIRTVLATKATNKLWRSRLHMLRSDFVSLIATVDVMVGNSSAGIIEAATFGTPVVNVGTRQFMRERNANVVDVEYCAEAITSAVRDAISKGKTISPNVYGDGSAGSRIVEVLAGYELDASLLAKSNAY